MHYKENSITYVSLIIIIIIIIIIMIIIIIIIINNLLICIAQISIRGKRFSSAQDIDSTKS